MANKKKLFVCNGQCGIWSRHTFFVVLRLNKINLSSCSLFSEIYMTLLEFKSFGSCLVSGPYMEIVRDSNNDHFS